MPIISELPKLPPYVCSYWITFLSSYLVRNWLGLFARRELRELPGVHAGIQFELAGQVQG